MVEAALLIERKTFEEMIRFVMKAMREGIPEEEIWATLEVMSSRELQADIAKGLKEITEGKVMMFRSAKEALEWLRVGDELVIEKVGEGVYRFGVVEKEFTLS